MVSAALYKGATHHTFQHRFRAFNCSITMHAISMTRSHPVDFVGIFLYGFGVLDFVGIFRHGLGIFDFVRNFRHGFGFLYFAFLGCSPSIRFFDRVGFVHKLIGFRP